MIKKINMDGSAGSRRVRVETPEQRELRRLKRYDWYLTGGVVVAILLGLGAVIGYAIWIKTSQDTQNVSIRNNANSITQLNMEVMQLFIETANLTTTTVLQSGTFEWVITEKGIARDNCFDSSVYLNTPQVTFNGTYELQSVSIGSLNFTILVISPPVEGPLVSEQVVDEIMLCLIRFTPAVAVLDNFGFALPDANIFTFTHANINRITASPNCITTEECYIAHGGRESFPVSDTYAIYIPTGPPPSPSDSFITYRYLRTSGMDFFPVPQSVTLSSSLQLMIFES